jgi:hypothetical protein
VVSQVAHSTTTAVRSLPGHSALVHRTKRLALPLGGQQQVDEEFASDLLTTYSDGRMYTRFRALTDG